MLDTIVLMLPERAYELRRRRAAAQSDMSADESKDEMPPRRDGVPDPAGGGTGCDSKSSTALASQPRVLCDLWGRV